MRVLVRPPYGWSVLLLFGFMSLWSGTAVATCEECGELATEVKRLALERDRVAERLESLEGSIQRQEEFLAEVRSKLTERFVEGDLENPEDQQRNVEWLLDLVRRVERSLATDDARRAKLQPRLVELEQRLKEAEQRLEECEREECGPEAEPAQPPCIDPLEPDPMPLILGVFPGSECSVCQDLHDEYRRLRSEALQLRRNVESFRREAIQHHEEAEALCRAIRDLDSIADSAPPYLNTSRLEEGLAETRREELRQVLAQLDESLAEERQALRELEERLRAAYTAYGAVADCEERYCTHAFQEPGSGGRVSSPSPIVLEDFEPVEPLAPHSSVCLPACAEALQRVNEAIVEHNLTAWAINQLIGELNAVKDEIAELRQTTSDVTDREIALFERGVALVEEISALRKELYGRFYSAVYLAIDKLDCEEEHCPPPDDTRDPSPRLVEVSGPGSGLFTQDGVDEVGSGGVEARPMVDLAVSKSGPAEAVAGSEITYVVDVVNQGLDAADFGLRDPIPIGAGFVSVTPEAGCSLSGRNLDCSGRLESGERREYRIVVEVLEGADTLRNVAAVNTVVGVTDPEPSNNISDVVVTRIVAEPAETDLSVSMSGPGTAAPGDPVRYDVRVENAGPDEATGVMVEITVPADIDVTGVGAGCTRSGRTVTCDLGNLAVGAAGSTFVEGTVADGASGTLTVEATVSANTLDPNPGNDRARRRTRVEEDEPEPTGCAALSGKFTAGGGDCGFSGSLNVSGTDGGQTLVLNPLGENGATRFSISGDTAQSESDNLVIRGQPNHRCKVTCRPPSRFTLDCESTRPGGRTCSQDFKKPQ